MSLLVTIIFEAHGTTVDNEAHRASGWNDVALSSLGEKQSREMGERYRHETFDAVFCSDLQRSIRSAKIAFADRDFNIRTDPRLRECNYGTMSGQPSSAVDPEKPRHIDKPFPKGESYTQTTARMKIFLDDLQRDFAGKKVMIIGHRATQYALENLILKRPLAEVIPAPWKWQPGWAYTL